MVVERLSDLGVLGLQYARIIIIYWLGKKLKQTNANNCTVAQL